MSVYYITFGTRTELQDYNLQYSPAAKQKSDYIIELLDRMIESYTVISLSRTGSRKLRWYPQKRIDCGSNGTYILWGMIGKPFRFFGAIQKILRKHQLNHFLLSCKKEDIVIVYHSLFIAETLKRAQKKIGFKLILELEELYQDVVNCTPGEAKAERDILDTADSFILATSFLEKKIHNEKKHITISGTYKVQPKLEEHFDDGKVHCVYAGTFDPAKGGAYAAVSAAEYLPKNYHVHILGFGTREQENLLLQQIDTVKKNAVCDLSFEGLKSGEEFTRFLQKCQIGLCTQIPEGNYIETSFPSKILVYLANGMRVLSARIPAVENSDVGDILFYYEEVSPEAIAEAIRAIDLNAEYDSRERLKELDRKATDEIRNLLGSINHEVDGLAEEQ